MAPQPLNQITNVRVCSVYCIYDIWRFELISYCEFHRLPFLASNEICTPITDFSRSPKQLFHVAKKLLYFELISLGFIAMLCIGLLWTLLLLLWILIIHCDLCNGKAAWASCHNPHPGPQNCWRFLLINNQNSFSSSPLRLFRIFVFIPLILLFPALATLNSTDESAFLFHVLLV